MCVCVVAPVRVRLSLRVLACMCVPPPAKGNRSNHQDSITGPSPLASKFPCAVMARMGALLGMVQTPGGLALGSSCASVGSVDIEGEGLVDIEDGPGGDLAGGRRGGFQWDEPDSEGDCSSGHASATGSHGGAATMNSSPRGSGADGGRGAMPARGHESTPAAGLRVHVVRDHSGPGPTF